MSLWDVEMQEPTIVEQGAMLAMHTFGLFSNGTVDKVSAAQVLAIPGGSRTAFDFSPIGATLVESTYSCSGMPVLVEGTAGPAQQWQAARWIKSICISFGRRYFDLHISLGACDNVLRQNGQLVQCDFIDAVTRGPVADVEHYTFAHLRAANMERLVIVDEPQSTAPACYSDCDHTTGVGVLDIFDFLCFGNHFANSNSYACNCDLSTGLNVCDIFDFLCFGNDFASGCP
jgi:hypothetical protein